MTELQLENGSAEELAWGKQSGLLPAIVQDATTLRVLMLGYMDRSALQTTLVTRQATFYSRSRARLWTKGETSGNTLNVVSVAADCDRDTLLVLAHPHGPTCHLGTPSCFAAPAPSSMLGNSTRSWRRASANALPAVIRPNCSSRA